MLSLYRCQHLIARHCLSLLVGLLCDSSVSAADTPAPPRAIQVRTQTPQLRALTDEVAAVGAFRADESVVLTAEIAGRIQSIQFKEGQAVQVGAPLIQINAAEARAVAAQSQAQAELDQLNFARLDKMHARSLISQQQWDEARARSRQAQAAAQRDRVLLDKTVLRAPFSGVLGLRQVSPGDYVSPGQALVNLEALDALKLDFTLPERYAGQVRADLSVQARVDAYPDRVFSGQVLAVDPRLEEQTRSVRVRARFANADHRLKPGMFARLSLALGAPRNALFVPEHALVGQGSRQSVYCVDNGVAHLIEVHLTGLHREGEAEIDSGLRADCAVVVDGQMKLRDGASVALVPE